MIPFFVDEAIAYANQPKIVEVTDETEDAAGDADQAPKVELAELISSVQTILTKVQPKTHVKRGSTGQEVMTMLRGNLCLLVNNFAKKCNAVGASSEAFKKISFSQMIVPLLDVLRKEEPSAQRNAGAAIVTLASMENYRALVRAHSGFEALSQIYAPLVQQDEAKNAPKRPY